jgi:hypothetical protein
MLAKVFISGIIIIILVSFIYNIKINENFIMILGTVDVETITETYKRPERAPIPVIEQPDGECRTCYQCGTGSNLTINYPEDSHRIPNSAFFNCQKISIVQLPVGLKIIGNNCFLNCYNLTQINLINSIEEIHYGAFKNCTSITTITLPDNPNFSNISMELFKGCTSLKEVDIFDCVTIIEEGAFENTALENITIPYSVTQIGRTAFKETNLTSVIFTLNPENNMSNLEIIGNSAFKGNSNLNNIVIPLSVGNIHDYAFKNCESLNTIRIPPSTDLGDDVFVGCGCDIDETGCEFKPGFNYINCIEQPRPSITGEKELVSTFGNCQIKCENFDDCENIKKCIDCCNTNISECHNATVLNATYFGRFCDTKIRD